MPLTFGEIKSLVAPYAGRAGTCADDAKTALFARKVMESLLYSGSEAAVRKICICSYKNCVVLPPEVEIPLKVRIDHKVSQVWNKWYSIHSSGNGFDRCDDADRVLIEDGTLSPLQYEIPKSGLRIGAAATCEEDENAIITVFGKDPVGKEIYTSWDGKTQAGETYRLKKDQARFGQVEFAQITAVKKPQTNGYVVLYAVDPVTLTRYFLADYSPSDEAPLYRKYKLLSRDCPPIAHVSILCRIRLKDSYHDNEVTPFSSAFAVELAAQRWQAETNNDTDVAAYKKSATEDFLNQEAGYKKTSGMPMDTFYPMSGGVIKNIV